VYACILAFRDKKLYFFTHVTQGKPFIRPVESVHADRRLPFNGLIPLFNRESVPS